MNKPFLDFSFPHRWQAQHLVARPLILPARHYIYPREAEEVERGALEILITPAAEPAAELARKDSPSAKDSLCANELPPAREPGKPSPCAQHFLATCALGFRDPLVPTGIWSCPNPEEICAVAGGYAYVIDATAPERFTMIPYRPVMQILPLPAAGLLLFVGHRTILAWAAQGQAWESEKLSDEGVTITGASHDVLHGMGWHLRSDRETPFALDLRSGQRILPTRA